MKFEESEEGLRCDECGCECSMLLGGICHQCADARKESCGHEWDNLYFEPARGFICRFCHKTLHAADIYAAAMVEILKLRNREVTR